MTTTPIAKELADAWLKLASDMNKDSGYVHGVQASIERTNLEDKWKLAHPTIGVPSILFCNNTGEYVVTGLLTQEDYYRSIRLVHEELHRIALQLSQEKQGQRFEELLQKQQELLLSAFRLDAQMR